jgi:hypothetical protein
MRQEQRGDAQNGDHYENYIKKTFQRRPTFWSVIAALDRLALLVVSEFRLAPHLHAVCLGSRRNSGTLGDRY